MGLGPHREAVLELDDVAAVEARRPVVQHAVREPVLPAAVALGAHGVREGVGGGNGGRVEDAEAAAAATGAGRRRTGSASRPGLEPAHAASVAHTGRPPPLCSAPPGGEWRTRCTQAH